MQLPTSLKSLRAPVAAALLSSLVVVGMSCASQLPRQLTDNTPAGYAEPLALQLVEFVDVRDGTTVNLEEYMDRRGRDFLLLTFGSQGCGACNDKGRRLTADVIGIHPLYLTEAAKRFEIIGVNTDPEPERLGSYLAAFPFIQWSDPAGAGAMLRFFMPPGNKFKVPLIVMISRRGIEWRIMPDEHVTVEQMMAQVEFTLGLRDTPTGADDGDSDGSGNGNGGHDGDVGGPAGPLSMPGAGRLKGVQLTACDGATTSLDDALGDASYRFVQVSSGACDAACQTNQQALQALTGRCNARGATCAAVSLLGAVPTAADCRSGIAYQGGQEFFTTFATHFNWTYPRELDPDTYLARLTRDVEGPLVLGFDAAGTLVYSREGALAAGELGRAVAAADFGAAAKGPDFRVYDRTRGEIGFSELRRGYDYTVVNAFGSMCSPCVAELKHWSEPGQLIDFCAARPGRCQVRAMETGEVPAGRTLAEHMDGLQHGRPDFDGFDVLHIRVPQILDPLPKYLGDGSENLGRLFEGYLISQTPDATWWGDPRVVIFDREGKIVAQFKTEDPAPGGDDPVLQKMKTLVRP